MYEDKFFKSQIEKMIQESEDIVRMSYERLEQRKRFIKRVMVRSTAFCLVLLLGGSYLGYNNIKEQTYKADNNLFIQIKEECSLGNYERADSLSEALQQDLKDRAFFSHNGLLEELVLYDDTKIDPEIERIKAERIRLTEYKETFETVKSYVADKKYKSAKKISESLVDKLKKEDFDKAKEFLKVVSEYDKGVIDYNIYKIKEERRRAELRREQSRNVVKHSPTKSYHKYYGVGDFIVDVICLPANFVNEILKSLFDY
jgi:hypothetical protein